jgi:hypothetical protein
MADSIERRVVAAAKAALDRNRFVAPIDVLTGLGWLRTEHAEAWRRGRVPYLERVTVASLGKLSRALRILRRWAELNGLEPRETVYVAWTRSRHRLRFTKTGDENLERAYRTHWISPELVAAKRRQMAETPALSTKHERAADGATAHVPGHLRTGVRRPSATKPGQQPLHVAADRASRPDVNDHRNVSPY